MIPLKPTTLLNSLPVGKDNHVSFSKHFVDRLASCMNYHTNCGSSRARHRHPFRHSRGQVQGAGSRQKTYTMGERKEGDIVDDRWWTCWKMETVTFCNSHVPVLMLDVAKANTYNYFYIIIDHVPSLPRGDTVAIGVWNGHLKVGSLPYSKLLREDYNSRLFPIFC